MKLCINCKHCLPSEATKDPEYSRCGFDRPISFVTGRYRPVQDLPFCSGERTLHSRCSPSATFWLATDDVMTIEEEEVRELMAGNLPTLGGHNV
jgi:hypothetical protein